MKIIQTKDSQSNNCNVEAWLQNELVLETSYTCRTYDSDLALYTAGDYKYANGDNRAILHGEIKNFSYIKK